MSESTPGPVPDFTHEDDAGNVITVNGPPHGNDLGAWVVVNGQGAWVPATACPALLYGIGTAAAIPVATGALAAAGPANYSRSHEATGFGQTVNYPPTANTGSEATPGDITP